ncbi:anaerobic carbon-monoxide dehydrogenase catalytic subunit [Halanaerobacter jeridensis]|uniref:Carbon monoxide dehydrogenase n=1 Tax=Halanaerobacter jeridensis TaxID=706427 RepID=A0A938XUD9_9FIRM|nr:anaerobic carbon-monoxide dehydrogenase catalytic subunit [Halanaerobacter jeridensis]MBM7555752.1 carbon-monoxide dehydrogenase catalytic subunit [Halanaerobacter jeridensis]
MSNEIDQKVNERTIDKDEKQTLKRTLEEDIETAWDRLEEQQPQCGFGQLGVCCNSCKMGPCQVDPFEEGPQRGVCGADANLIVARNLLNDIAAGAASHSDHGREIVETFYETAKGESQGYELLDTEKLKNVAQDVGIEVEDRSDEEIAKELGETFLAEYGMIKGGLDFTERVPEKTRKIWNKAGIMPRGVDREVVESMHRVHMGVGADYTNMLLHGLRTALSDGWGGSMMATELSDILFGTPEVTESTVNLGTLKDDMVNIVLHGHNPILSDVVVKAANNEALVEKAKEAGANGINLVGLCCTGNELLMRKGVPMAGNMLNQELALATGAVDAMIIDYQCIFPSLPQVAKCFHSKIVSTSEKSKVPGAVHKEFHPESAYDTATEIVELAIDTYKERNPQKVEIPCEPMEMVAGFSVEAIKDELGGTFEPLIEAITSGQIKGVVGVVGCSNPKVQHDYGHVNLAKELMKKDILMIETGCAAVASGKEGLLVPEAAEMAGDGLQKVCESLNIPPVLHMGSCVDCSRILTLAGELANALDVGIDQLPAAGAAPEWYAQKALTIASYFVASGFYTVVGLPPNTHGSQKVTDLLTDDLEDVVNAKFDVEPDPKVAARMIERHILSQREELGI